MVKVPASRSRPRARSERQLGARDDALEHAAGALRRQLGDAHRRRCGRARRRGAGRKARTTSRPRPVGMRAEEGVRIGGTAGGELLGSGHAAFLSDPGKRKPLPRTTRRCVTPVRRCPSSHRGPPASRSFVRAGAARPARGQGRARAARRRGRRREEPLPARDRVAGGHDATPLARCPPTAASRHVTHAGAPLLSRPSPPEGCARPRRGRAPPEPAGRPGWACSPAAASCAVAAQPRRRRSGARSP